MKKILMIATGGTIACTVSENGLAPALSGNDLLQYVPKLKDICQIDVLEIMNIDSSNISPKHYKMMIETIEENYNLYDGFVITHGTDTMAYSSSFLSNAIENLSKPVVFTGSQLPMQVDYTDAKDNIYGAFLTASSSYNGVFLVFNNSIHKGSYVKKIYTTDFTGFLSINENIAGKIENNNIIWNINPVKYNETVKFNKEIYENIFVLKIIPSLKPDIINMLVDMGYKGIIIEGYGAGGVPCDNEKDFIPAIKYAMKNGVAVVCITQCLYNGVHLDKYPMGVLAEKSGAISAKNMTLENTLAKLMIGLGKNMDNKALKKHMENN